MEKVVIVSGVRTPIGAYGGTLKELHVTKYAGFKRSLASTPEN